MLKGQLPSMAVSFGLGSLAVAVADFCGGGITVLGDASTQ
jgi:hypothetical protein